MADNKAFQKKANISLVMQTIRNNREISRIDISRKLGLDRSTITNIVTKLIEGELLLELSEGTSVSKGGRKPVLLGINHGFGVVLGLEIKVEKYRATLMTLDGDIVWNKCGINMGLLSLTEIISNIYHAHKEDIYRHSSTLLGIGIGLPGHIDPLENKILNSSPFFKKNGYKEDFSRDFDVPVLLDNDANCCAWGVLEDRKGESLKNFLYSILEFRGNETKSMDNEIGFGIVVNGEVYYGSNFAAGELWNSLVDKNENNENLELCFSKIIDKLALFIAFLNPSHLYLGGEFINHQELILNLINGSLINKRCEVVFSSRKEFDVSFGAASMFIERLFKIPDFEKTFNSRLTWEELIDVRNRKEME